MASLGSTSITAITRNLYRNTILTSIHGRRNGLDARDYQVGYSAIREDIDAITTTAATSLTASGLSVLCATPASSAIYTLTNAAAGVRKSITQTSTPAVGFQIQFGANANISTTAGSSFNQATISQQGATLGLFCISSSTANGPQWTVTGVISTGIAFSTY